MPPPHSLEAPRIGLLPLNGAVARVPARRQRSAVAAPAGSLPAGGTWDAESEDVATRTWIEQLHEAVAKDASGVGYANMMGEGRPVYTPWTHARLRAVKAQWDPANVFRSNHNIRHSRNALISAPGRTIDPDTRCRSTIEGVGMTGYALTETPLGQPLGREATELEPKDERRRTTLGSSNSGRIVLAIAVMIALLGAAVTLSIWRYEAALNDAALEAVAHQEQF